MENDPMLPPQSLKNEDKAGYIQGQGAGQATQKWEVELIGGYMVATPYVNRLKTARCRQ